MVRVIYHKDATNGTFFHNMDKINNFKFNRAKNHKNSLLKLMHLRIYATKAPLSPLWNLFPIKELCPNYDTLMILL